MGCRIHASQIDSSEGENQYFACLLFLICRALQEKSVFSARKTYHFGAIQVAPKWCNL